MEERGLAGKTVQENSKHKYQSFDPTSFITLFDNLNKER